MTLFEQPKLSQMTLFEQPKLSQKKTILMELSHRRPLCGTWLLRMHMPRYAARINELRAYGHDIETVRCEEPYHNHRANIAAYLLTR